MQLVMVVMVAVLGGELEEELSIFQQLSLEFKPQCIQFLLFLCV